jgi:hypothetical protein
LGTTPFALCVAIDNYGEPCTRKAKFWIGPTEDFKGQPFCFDHFKVIGRHFDHELAARHARQLEQEFHSRLTEHRKAVRGAAAKQKSWVYFAVRADTVKIGVSVQPDKRLRTLERANGVRFDRTVVVPGTRTLEQQYHRRFAEHRLEGEWFKLDREIVTEMNRLSNEGYVKLLVG